MNRRTFLLMAPFAGALAAKQGLRAEGGGLPVEIPEGECVTACWDETMTEVPCGIEEDVCPDYVPPVVIVEPGTGYTDTPGDELVVVQLPNTGSGTLPD